MIKTLMMRTEKVKMSMLMLTRMVMTMGVVKVMAMKMPMLTLMLIREMTKKMRMGKIQTKLITTKRWMRIEIWMMKTRRRQM